MYGQGGHSQEMTFVTGLYEDQRKLFWFLLFGIFAVLTFVFYHSSLGNFYVLDDFVRLRVVTEGNLHENFHFISIGGSNNASCLTIPSKFIQCLILKSLSAIVSQ